MNNEPFFIKGSCFSDKRGKISFVNAFNFPDVKRFYIIKNRSVKTIRAWQAHKLEKKYFFSVKGSFIICTVKIDNWENPSPLLPVKEFLLHCQDNQILVIPPGYANGFRAFAKDSYLLVYSNLSLVDSEKDDYRFPQKLWYKW